VTRNVSAARRLFLASIVYLASLCALLIGDRLA
jgi:heme O synthase-like polyprenyltransferase